MHDKYQLLIINDPLKKDKDFNKLIQNIKNIYKKTFMVFINLNKKKLNYVTENLKIKDSLIISKNRNILFCSIN